MLLKKQLLKFIFSFLFLLIFLFFVTPPKAQAAQCDGYCYIYVTFENGANNTSWQTRFQTQVGAGAWSAWNQLTVPGGGTKTTAAVASYNYGDTIPDSVLVHWAQSCVDPTVATSVGSGSWAGSYNAGVYAFYAHVGISCYNPGLSTCTVNHSWSGTEGYAAKGLSPADYAACPGLNDYGHTVNLCNVCPSNTACAVNGSDIGTGTCASNCASGYTCSSTGSNWGTCGPTCSPPVATATPEPTVTVTPTRAPTVTPTRAPTVTPTRAPTVTPTRAPTVTPTRAPTVTPPPPTVTPPPTTHLPHGNFDDADCNSFRGWTCDADNYNSALRVDFYDGAGLTDSTFIGHTTADQYGQDLVDANVCGGGGNHRFNFTTPASLKDNATHQIYAYAYNVDSSGNQTGNNPAVGGSPISFKGLLADANWSNWSPACDVCGKVTQNRTCQGTASCGGTDYCGGQSSQTQSCTPTEVLTLSAPTGLAPNGTIAAGPQNITWNTVSGANNYAIRINDLDPSANWDNNGSCKGPGSGDTNDSNGNVCANYIGNVTSYSYTFVAGHSYHIWVHAINDCAPWSDPSNVYPNVYTNVVGTVFTDYNDNGFQEIQGQGGWKGLTEPGYAGVKVTLSNGQSATTISDGSYTISNVAPGTYTASMTNDTKPAGNITYPNLYPPTVYAYSPNITQNFGIQPPPPDCTLTATSPIYVGQASALKTSSIGSPGVAGCKIGGGTGTLNYTWSPVVLDPSSPSNPPTSLIGDVNETLTGPTNTYTVPAAGNWFQQFIVDATVTACNQGSNPGTVAPNPVCTSKTVTITVNPLFAVSGFVYIDANKNGRIDTATENYYPTGVIGATSLRVNVCQGTCNLYPVGTDGHFNTGYVLPSGSTSVALDGSTLPSGYELPVPILLTTVGTVGVTCSVPATCNNHSTHPYCTEGSVCCACDTNSNVTNLPFGINNSHVWIQTIGGDVYEKGGVTNKEPSNAACGGAYMSISQNPPIQMPGIIFTGNGSADFGAGNASLNNWLVGKGNSYPNTITLQQTSSYTSVSKLVGDAHLTPAPVDLAIKCTISSCTLPNSLPPGVYTVKGDLTLIGVGTNNGQANTFPTGGAFTFLIDGNLTIKTKIHVPLGSIPDGTGSFVLFTASGDIHVDKSIGESVKTSTTPDIEGFYSADKNFYIDGNISNNPPTKDLKLNVEGAVVANATNVSPSIGSFQINRDMYEDDDCPTFALKSRPDFVLNAPSYLQTATRIWQEIAP